MVFEEEEMITWREGGRQEMEALRLLYRVTYIGAKDLLILTRGRIL